MPFCRLPSLPSLFFPTLFLPQSTSVLSLCLNYFLCRFGSLTCQQSTCLVLRCVFPFTFPPTLLRPVLFFPSCFILFSLIVLLSPSICVLSISFPRLHCLSYLLPCPCSFHVISTSFPVLPCSSFLCEIFVFIFSPLRLCRK